MTSGSVAAEELLERLAQHRLIGGAPRKEHEWLIAHSEFQIYEAGEALVQKGDPMRLMFVLLSGHASIRVDRGAGPRKVLEWRGGEISGVLPYSRMQFSPGDTSLEERTELLAVERAHFPEMIRECPFITDCAVHIMLDRARAFNSSDLHDEKMLSLGKLSAGLAHELNNPASAASRSARQLSDALAEADAASRALGAANLTAEQRAVLDGARETCLIVPLTAVLTPLERSDREEEFAEWLDDHGADNAAASSLADTSAGLDLLDRLAAALDGPALHAAVRWIAAGCTVRSLAREIEQASTRIYDLVAAIKRFTYMDHQSVAEATDLSQGLTDTLSVMLAKARSKSVRVETHIQPGLPRVRAFGGELNQVWTNLIDNAIDAVPIDGKVTVTARRELDRVVVSVVDNGGGIPESIRSRIFDPFYTTKPVGQGTGLGLDIAQRLVRRHEGEIAVESRPGRTEFRVSFPIATDGVAAPAAS
jgi:signal transduction histidine kinase